jgi:hypothetical protein
LILFPDAFASCRKLKAVGHEAILLSASEFDTENKWSADVTPFVVPFTVHNVKAKSGRFPNSILKLMTEGLEQCSKGVVVESAYRDNANVRVFAQVHAIIGDLPARLEIGSTIF